MRLSLAAILFYFIATPPVSGDGKHVQEGYGHTAIELGDLRRHARALSSPSVCVRGFKADPAGIIAACGDQMFQALGDEFATYSKCWILANDAGFCRGRNETCAEKVVYGAWEATVGPLAEMASKGVAESIDGMVKGSQRLVNLALQIKSNPKVLRPLVTDALMGFYLFGSCHQRIGLNGACVKPGGACPSCLDVAGVACASAGALGGVVAELALTGGLGLAGDFAAGAAALPRMARVGNVIKHSLTLTASGAVSTIPKLAPHEVSDDPEPPVRRPQVH